MQRLSLARYFHKACWIALLASLLLALCLAGVSQVAFGVEEGSAESAEPAAADASLQTEGSAESDVHAQQAEPAASNASAVPEGALGKAIEDAPTLDLADGPIYLTKSDRVAYHYSRDNTNWTPYTGALTITGTSALTNQASISIVDPKNTRLAYDLVLKDVDIAAPRAEVPAIDVDGDSVVHITLAGANVISGGPSNPAVRVSGSVTFYGSGSLSATGGANAPAMGADALGSSFGVLNFEHTGIIDAHSGSGAPALGDPVQGGVEPGGMVGMYSGTLRLHSDGASDIITKEGFHNEGLHVNGGSIEFSKPHPPIYFPSGPMEGDTPAARVGISGLPAGVDLTTARLKIGTRSIDRDFFTNELLWDDEDIGHTEWYCVNGLSPTKADATLHFFFPTSDLADGMPFSITADGVTYEGTLRTSSALGGFDALLKVAAPPQNNPVLGLSAIQQKGLKLQNNSYGEPQYSVDGGVTWTRYLGSVIVDGGPGNGQQFGNVAPIVALGGNQKLRLQNVSVYNGLAPLCAIIEVANSADLTVTLVGKNSLNSRQYTPVCIAKTGKLTIEGKGSLEVVTGQMCSAAIGGNENEAAGALVVNGGSITARSEYGGAAIGSGVNGSMKAITINGGVVRATAFSFSAGIGSGHKGSVDSITINGGKVYATGGMFACGLGQGHRGTVGSMKITGGTIEAKGDEKYMPNISAATITGGTINGTKHGSSKTRMAEPLDLAGSTESGVSLLAAPVLLNDSSDADSLDDSQKPAFDPDQVRGGVVNPTNEAGAELYPVAFYGLPANTNLADFHLRLLDADFVDDPADPNDYGVRDVTTDDAGTLTFFLSPDEAKDKLVVASWNGRTYMGTVESDAASKGYSCGLEPTEAALYYQGHTFEQGWLFEDAGIPWSFDAVASGSPTGNALTALRFESPIAGLAVSYAADNGAGWSDAVSNGDIAGEMSAPLQGMRLSLSGEQAANYQVHYRVYVEGIGWMGWAADDQMAGTTGRNAAIKAVQAAIMPAGAGIPAADPSDVDQAYLTADAELAPAVKPVSPDAKPLAGNATSLVRTGDATLPLACAAVCVGVGALLVLLAAIRRSKVGR